MPEKLCHIGAKFLMIEVFKATGMVKNCPRLSGDSNWMTFNVSKGKALNTRNSIFS